MTLTKKDVYCIVIKNKPHGQLPSIIVGLDSKTGSIKNRNLLKGDVMYNSKEQFEEEHNYVVLIVSVVGDVYVKNFKSRKSAEKSDAYFNRGEVMTRRQYKKWLSDNKEKFSTGEYHFS